MTPKIIENSKKFTKSNYETAPIETKIAENENIQLMSTAEPSSAAPFSARAFVTRTSSVQKRREIIKTIKEN